MQDELQAYFCEGLALQSPSRSNASQFELSSNGQISAALRRSQQGSQIDYWELQAGKPLVTIESGLQLDLYKVCDDGSVLLGDGQGIYRWRAQRSTALETLLTLPEASRLLRGGVTASDCGGHLVWEEVKPGRSGFLGLLSGHSHPEAHAQHYQPASQKLSSWPGYKVAQDTPGQLLLRISPACSKAAMLVRGPKGWSLGLVVVAREALLTETQVHPQENSPADDTPELTLDDNGTVAIAFEREVQILKPTPDGLLQRTSASLRDEQHFQGFWGGWFFIESDNGQHIRLAWSSITSHSQLGSPPSVIQAFLLSGADRLTVGQERPAQLHYPDSCRVRLNWWADAASWQPWSQLSSQPVAIGGVQLQILAEDRQVTVRRS